MEEKRECSNTQPCSCPSKDCVRHDKCCECVAYHRSRGDIPMCLRQ